MSHIRLGRLPRTREWKQVVALIEGGAGTVQIANATINAADDAFSFVRDKKMARYEEFKRNCSPLTVDEASSIVDVELPT